MRSPWTITGLGTQDQRAEVLEYLETKGPTRSDLLHERWPRAQARLHELRRTHYITTKVDPDSGLTIYSVEGERPKPLSKHDIGLRITGSLPELEVRIYSLCSLSGTLPEDILERAAQAAHRAVRSVLEAEGYLDEQEESEDAQNRSGGPTDADDVCLDDLMAMFDEATPQVEPEWWAELGIAGLD